MDIFNYSTGDDGKLRVYKANSAGTSYPQHFLCRRRSQRCREPTSE